jgi:fructokinase
MNQFPCVFGEVLFDHFPDGSRVLGGAPFNVAWHLQAFGQAPLFISRVGQDAEGDGIRIAMQDWGMAIDALQADPELPTGRVAVSFDDGEPSYDIVHPCAYDAISEININKGCSLLYHGSLAARDETSRQALLALKEQNPAIIFVDVNLRPPWWNKQQVLEMLDAADWVKLNTDELMQLHPGQKDIHELARSFIKKHTLQGLILTHGARGAELLSHDGTEVFVAPEKTTEVVDTVGAGDAFASVVMLGLLNDWDASLTLQRAQAFASGIVGNRGATVSDPGFYQSFLDQWQLNG